MAIAEGVAKVERKYGLALGQLSEALSPPRFGALAKQSDPAQLGKVVQFAAELQEITTAAPNLTALPVEEKLRVARLLRQLLSKYSDSVGRRR